MSSTLPPAWIDDFAEEISSLMLPTAAMAPVGCHFHREDDVWEITIFASATEVVGGQRDGLRYPSRFILDVGGVMGVIGDVASIRWQVLPEGTDDEIGAHLAIEGTYAGERLLLRIPAKAPERFDVGRFANVHEMRYVNVW